MKKQFIPFLILFGLLTLLAYELFYHKKEIPSPLIGSSVPQFNLPNLSATQLDLNNQNLPEKIILLNFWASWCDACLIEHKMLMKIAKTHHIPIYGIVYKDNPNNALSYLSKHGNPYTQLGNDARGDVAIDFGVYGTPETYVIYRGKIIYKHTGIITEEIWDKELYPLVEKYET